MAPVYYLAAALALGLLSIKLFEILRQAFLTPLRKVPGPWYARLTNFVLKYHVIVGDRTDYIHDLHKQYGAFVRISPWEVAVNDTESAKEIHRVNSAYAKHEFYQTMSSGGPDAPLGIFNMIDSKQHSERRKMLSRGFSKAALREQWHDMVTERIKLAIAQIRQESETKGSADILRWWLCMAADVSANVMFGQSFSTLEAGEKAEYLVAIEHGIIGSAIYAELYPIWLIGRRLPFQACKFLFHANDILYQKGSEAWARAKSNPHVSNVFDTVVANAEKDDPLLTEREAITESGNLILAGTDTTANTLTYMIYSILANPSLQESLYDEVRDLAAPFTDAALEALPLLNATLDETLRLYCAAPASEPRVVPVGGATLGSYYLPAGTAVSTQPWSMHRRPELWPEPEKFDVSRWLKEGGVGDAARASFMPWGGGSRICLGMHLAKMELRLAAVEFLRAFPQARLAPGTDAESMRVENRFLITPVGHKCEVVV